MTRRPAVLILASTLVVSLFSVATMQSQDGLAPLPADVPSPADNPTTPDKVALGRLLFWDPILSGEKDVACATCHHPAAAYGDNRDVSIGVNGLGLGAARTFAEGNTIPLVKRNSQTVLNSAWNGLVAVGHAQPETAPMFWDMRARSLEAQSLEPIKALEEMRGNAYPEAAALETVVARVAAIPEYRTLFARAFGPAARVDEGTLGKAIAAYERSLVASNSPFDRYMRGDASAMTPLQIRGLQRFRTVGCANCHGGPMLSDYQLHVLGVPDNRQLADSDTGAGGGYAFRTPSLRNVALTAPYMHSGVFPSLDRVIQFYDNVRGGGGRGGRGGGRGGNANRNPNVARDSLDPLLRQLNNLGRGRQDLVAFLQSLSDPSFDRTIPERVPSGLAVGGAIQ